MEQKDFDTGLKYAADNCEYRTGARSAPVT